MNPLRLITAAAVAFLCCAHAARATTVIPPSLDELVEASASVVRTHVLDARCEWRGTGEERHIVTLVTFAVDESIVGTTEATMELEFLGGEIDGERFFVVGQPQFKPGHEDILFVSRESNVITPLVRMMYGRYLVDRRDDGRALVARIDGTPLLALDQVSAPLGTAPSEEVMAMILAADPYTPDRFCDAVRDIARQQGRSDVSANQGGAQK